jgi:hypothetical protein
MPMKRFALLLALVLALAGTMASAQTLTGTIEGTVTDEQGGVLPGVTVTLIGRQGNQTTVTDERGAFRFVGLNPGLYDVQSELSGFTTRTERGLDVGIGKTLTVPFTMRVGGLAENVEVVANASTIDTSSTASDNSLSQDLLANMPINIGNFNTATSIMNFTPGVNDGAAFGGDEDYGNALMIDGVDTRDPEAGSAWVFYNYNIIEEVQVGGVGASAEYGGFTGAVVNTITKSGGNLYSGLFEVRHTNDSLAGDNVSDEYIDQNPALASPNVLTKLWDYTVQLGGPFVKDRAFWWFGIQRYAIDQDLSGPAVRTEVSPRYNGKLTFQLSPNDSLNVGFQYDNYNVTGRAGLVPSAEMEQYQTLDQDSPEAVWNVQYRRIFGSNTFLEAKYTGYWGYYYLDPVDPTPYRFDGGTGANLGGAGYYYYADRDRNQVNASVSTYADKFGQHNFKFGVEIERSTSRSRFDYMNGVYYYDYYGVPYYAYGYSYDIEGKNKRESYYAQDQWKIGRLTANLGLRLDHITGHSPNLNQDVYTPDLAWGPRLGATYDLTGRGTSVLKGSWGRYFEGAAFNPYNQAVGGYTPFSSYIVHGEGDLELIDQTTVGGNWHVAPDIKHFGLDEVTLGFEQQLRRDMRFAVTGIWREWDNFTGAVIPGSTWIPFTRTNPLDGQPYTAYRWANRSATADNTTVTNYAGFRYVDPSGNVLGTADPYREYKGVMFVLTKSWSNRWQGQFSYVWSEAKGDVGNAGRAGFGGVAFRNPNTAITNTDGYLENDRTHEFKAFGGYQIPKIEVAVNAYYRGVSGRTYTPVANVSGSSSVLNWTGSLNIFMEPRGSRRYEAEHIVDLRAEKVFNVGIHRFGVFMDVANLFNNDTVIAVQTRVPSRSILGNTVLFDSPTALVGARQLTFGGRWSF